MNLYANPNNEEHIQNCAEFERFMARFSWAEFFFPNQEKAPWHVQCILTTDIGYQLHLDFWPHKLKGRYESDAIGVKTIFEGIDGLREMMARAIDDCRDKEEFDVLEG